MKKILGVAAFALVILVISCKEECETNDTGSVKISNTGSGWNPDSIDVYMGLSKLGMVRLGNEKVFDKLPAGKREFLFKYQGDTLYIDSITVIACNTVNYTIDWLPISDKRLKKNIQPLSPTLAALLNLQTYSFEYDRTAHPNYVLPAGTQFGFMAQDLQQDFPMAVKPYRDGYYAVDYNQMVPVLTKAIQEQQAEIDALKKDMAALRQMLGQQSTATR